ncbi:DUF427 domain-containing protein [Bradyrhizobium guangzhouense]|uniref:DUF427 domain-containing protein n=1 Tax=Bradyrhizobium guangzhouense TaxID=1325095 RepID=A0AAE5WWJ4_9BRAD|nr:DUF427 domain-containing protein [Bradyrhizobium guangzhouense]QAU44392.1 hypothetical protein XH91_02825 [Bradyrhizobium guangzhouense]RXH09302.1 DUF427 domain-containing protein [Bradyrhizobium guangzhouense]RXH10037.1 DUF427 domain-containing protein [Bradyrhizobium guangzhouense]
MESVWDYPRPPRLEPVSQQLEVIFNGKTVARTTHGYRVLETSHPPVYYFPPADVDLTTLASAEGRSWCEFKGLALYWAVEVDGKTADKAAWCYPNPTEPYSAISGFYAFYASRVDQCKVGGELVRAQPGDFYGGWITSDIVGPFKGIPGSRHW